MSESNNPQVSAEYLQDGIIFRFNEVKIDKVDDNNEISIYKCDELWIEILEELDNVLLIENLILTEEQINFIKKTL